MSKKQKRIYKTIIISLAALLTIEIIYFGVKIYHSRKVSTFYDVINSAIIKDNNNYVGAGFSDYRYSKFNKYDKGYEKATIIKVKNNKVIKEVGLIKGYNARYNDIIETDDGYIAVGKIEMTKEQNKEGMSEGLIVKYDKNFKVVWRQNLSILEKTELNKVKLDGNDIVVVGSSIYSDGYIGNHTTGGAILLKYDNNGKEKLRVNYGGPYTGSFNDLIIEKDSYVVAGLGKSNSGILLKYDKDGKKLATGSFGYTDKTGINAIAKMGDNYVAATTKVVNPKKLDNYSAAIVLFNDKLDLIDSAKYSDQSINYFNDIKVDKDNNIYACGYTGKVKGKSVLSDAIIVKYDKDLYEKQSDALKGNKNDFYSHVYLNNKDSIYVLGYSNSKLKEYKVNGYDYSKVLKKYNNKLK